MWRTPLPPPSERTSEDIPAELDALVQQLLSYDQLLRPSSTAEVIDRIDALIGAHADSDRDAALARLKNVAFVGRTRIERTLQTQLALALGGQGQACLIEPAAGVERPTPIGYSSRKVASWQTTIPTSMKRPSPSA